MNKELNDFYNSMDVSIYVAANESKLSTKFADRLLAGVFIAFALLPLAFALLSVVL